METIHTGGTVQVSGSYKCVVCGNGITCVKGETVPPCAQCKEGRDFVLVYETR